MSKWKLFWNFNTEIYQPNSSGKITFYLENLNNISLFVSDIGIRFDWMGDNFYHIKIDENYGKLIPSRGTHFITNINLKIPQNVSGQTFYNIYYHLYEYYASEQKWIDLGGRWSEDKYFINIIPLPYYRLFLTRSLAPEDRIIGEEIIRILKEWGFNPYTVEFKEVVSDIILRERIRKEILNSDCLIAIATPRYLDALSDVWRTFPYLHAEVGIAFGQDYPTLILVDNRVTIDGLPSILKEYMIKFDPYNFEKTRKKISAIMPIFRKWISNKKWEDFKEKLKEIGIGVGLLTLGGIAGFLIASSEKDR